MKNKKFITALTSIFTAIGFSYSIFLVILSSTYQLPQSDGTTAGSIAAVFEILALCMTPAFFALLGLVPLAGTIISLVLLSKSLRMELEKSTKAYYRIERIIIFLSYAIAIASFVIFFVRISIMI